MKKINEVVSLGLKIIVILGIVIWVLNITVKEEVLIQGPPGSSEVVEVGNGWYSFSFEGNEYIFNPPLGLSIKKENKDEKTFCPQMQTLEFKL